MTPPGPRPCSLGTTGTFSANASRSPSVNQFRRYILRFAFLQTATDCGRDRSFWVTRTRSEYGRSHAVTGGRAQAGSACQPCQTYIADETAQQKQGTAFLFCPSVNAGTRLRPFSTGEAEPDEARVGMHNPDSLHPLGSPTSKRYSGGKRENEKNTGRCLENKSST